MGKYLVWMMALVGYSHALYELELPTGLYLVFEIVAIIAYIVWTLEDKDKR